MTLEQWLQEATASFPAGVQRRLAQEYRAHLDESVSAGGTGDPVALFGAPEQVFEQLERTYITTSRLRNLGTLGEGVYWLGSVLLLALIGVRLAGTEPYALAGCGMTAVLWLGVWHFTRNWQQRRRASAKRSGVWILFLLLQALGSVQFLGVRQGGTAEILVDVGARFLMGLSLFVWARQAIIDDARLRRTLELEGVYS